MTDYAMGFEERSLFNTLKGDKSFTIKNSLVSSKPPTAQTMSDKS